MVKLFMKRNERRRKPPGRRPRGLDQLAVTNNRPGRRGQKDQQLCRQVERALALTLPGCSDPLLGDLIVRSVIPAPDATHLLVFLSSSGRADAANVLAALSGAAGLLRHEIARAITRKRAPELSFQLVAPQAEVPS